MITAAQQDAYRREGRFDVLRVAPAGDGTFHAWLSDSVLYAEAGGQPSDRGTIDGVAVRSVSAAPDGLLHVLDGPIGQGSAQVVLDWARRYDHMQQHTGQHLLSAVAQDRLGWPTTSFHLHPGPENVCDVELATEAATPDAVAALQEAVNAEIRAARAVGVRTVSPEALASVSGLRSRGLPDGHEGPVRLVDIDGVDTNTCGGTHVRSTAELQAIVLLGTERIRGGTRLRFVAGGRVIARLAASEERLAGASALLSRGPAEIVDGVRRLLAEAKEVAKARDAAEAELADALGAALAAAPPGSLRVLHRPSADPAFLHRVASGALAADPAALAWLTAGEGEEGVFLLAGPPERVAAHKEAVLSLLEGRGGGKPGRLGGRAARLSARGEVERRLREG